MKSRVGIITVHKNTNYGANLQAFASCRYLQKQGCDVCVVDYTIPSHERLAHLFSWLKTSWDAEPQKSLGRKIKLGAALLLSAGEKKRRLRAFSRFRKRNMTLSTPCRRSRDIRELSLDTIVCGSDQIWNPSITEGVNPIFYGDVEGVKTRISYAASVGKSALSPEDERKVLPLIKALDYCSVREAQTAEYLGTLTGRDIQTVCDPVFLLDKSDYEAVLSKRKIKGDYVLLYSIIQDDGLTAAALDYARRHGLPLVEICQARTKGAKHKQVTSWGPAEFLSAFKHAETVFTNSFHGTAFALIFEKDFYIFDNKHGGSRITNLLSTAGLGTRLTDRIVTEDAEPIEYNKVRARLDDYTKASKEFLSRALSAEKKPTASCNCIGCGACAAACPRDAIRFVKDNEGFDIAYTDTQKCIDCGLCERACPALNSPEKNDPARDVYAFKARDEIRKGSTSGGAFAVFAEAALREGGVFYGAVMDKDGSVSHLRGQSVEDIALMQGTKYVPSSTADAFVSVIDDLKAGRSVLFSGTPCQIDALNRLVKAKSLPADKLYTVDIICHGVPSGRVFDDYLTWLEDKIGSKVVEYKFRSKKISWRGNSVYVRFASGKELKNELRASAFMNMYYSGNITRESCYSCKYTSHERVSDITISDFWGIEGTNAEFEDKLGVSMIMINTERGKTLFDATEGERVLADVSAAKQPQLNAPQKMPLTREQFWEDYRRGGIKLAVKKYGGARLSLKSRIYNLIKGK